MSISKLILAAAVGVAAVAGTQALAADGTVEVIGLTTKKHLNVRDNPSMQGNVFSGLLMGEAVKNLGCKDSAEGRWCNVELKDGRKGWSHSRYLKEAMAVAEAPKAEPTPQRFSIGKLKCEKLNGSPAGECDYGLLRFSPTMSRLQVVWPDSTKHMFGIFGGTVTSGDGAVKVKAGADGNTDMTITPKGSPSEHFVVPAGIIAVK